MITYRLEKRYAPGAFDRCETPEIPDVFFEYGAITELLRSLGDGLLGSDVAAFELTRAQFRMQAHLCIEFFKTFSPLY